jgi:hypothetical protein
MLYATAELHLLSGEILHQQVVETFEGIVVSFVPFTCENHAMTFVPHIYLFDRLPGESGFCVAGQESALYAFTQDKTGSWILLY